MKIAKYLLLPFMMAFLGFTASPSYAVDTPEKIDNITVVDADGVQKILADGGLVVDARIASEYADAHMKGAVSIPYREKSAKAMDFDSAQDEFDMSKLPSDKNHLIAFYCNGIYCWKSPKAAVLAVRAGYTNIHWYRLGLDDWKAKKLPLEQ